MTLDVGDQTAVQAAVAEFIIEALHCHNRLNKQAKGTGFSYRG